MSKKLLAGIATGIYVLCVVGMASAEIYGGVEFEHGAASFADEVMRYQPTDGVSVLHNDPSAALGIPDYRSDSNYVSLGDNGILFLKFTDNSLTTSGDDSDDLCLFEIGTKESFSVEISPSGLDWISVGNSSGGTYGINIDDYLSFGVVLGEKYSYVKLTDLLPSETGSPYSGADIDAVGAIRSALPVPIPGAVWLLGAGIAGLSGLRTR